MDIVTDIRFDGDSTEAREALEDVGDAARDMRARVEREASRAQRAAQAFGRGLGVAAKGAALGVAAVATAAVGASAAVMAMARQFADVADAATRQAAAVGLTVEQFTALESVTRTVNVEGDALRDVLADLSEKAVNSTAAFKQWGIETRNTNGTLKTSDELLESVADRMAETESATARAAMATQLMGGNGRNMIPVLMGGAAALRSLRDEMIASGAAISNVEAAVGTNLATSFSNLERQVQVTSGTFASIFGPAIMAINEQTGETAKAITVWMRQNKALIDSGIQQFLFWIADNAIPAIATGVVMVAKAWTGWRMIVEGLRVVVAEFFAYMADGFRVQLDAAARVAQAFGQTGLAGQIRSASSEVQFFSEAMREGSQESQRELHKQVRELEELETTIEGLSSRGSDRFRALAARVSEITSAMEGAGAAAKDATATTDRSLALTVEAARNAADEVNLAMTGAADASAQAWMEALIAAQTQALDTSRFIGESFGQVVLAATDGAEAVGRVVKKVSVAVLGMVQQQLQAHIAAKAIEAATSKATAVQTVTANAAVAASGAAASQAGIPVVGPILAQAALAAMFALVMGLIEGFNTGGIVGGRAASMGPNRDSVLASLTPGELVLDREATGAILRSISGRGGSAAPRSPSGGGGGGGGGGGTTINRYEISASYLPENRVELERFALRHIETQDRLRREGFLRPTRRS